MKRRFPGVDPFLEDPAFWRDFHERFVIYCSDAMAAHPKENPVHASDFVATIYHALGYDGSTKVVDQLGRPHYAVKGQPVLAMF